MAVHRDVWKSPFEEWPELPCPTCKIGLLKIDLDSIVKTETALSIEAHDHDAWDPDWITETFSGRMICARSDCLETIQVIGRNDNELYQGYDERGKMEQHLNPIYYPIHFWPPPPVFTIPDECPSSVSSLVEEAFGFLWSDLAACANRLRTAIETLLSAQNIPKKGKIKNGKNKGKFEDLSLHKRIERYKKKNDTAANHLMAIKWLGNAGSHASLVKLGNDDLLDAFEHLEYALDLIYTTRAKLLEERANKINKRRGPLSS